MTDNLQKLIQLAKADGGKFFVIDEQGNPVLVIMSVDEYEKVLIRKVGNQIEDIEDINKRIVEAQKEDLAATQRQAFQDELKSEVIDSTFEFEPEMRPIEPGMARAAELEDI